MRLILEEIDRQSCAIEYGEINEATGKKALYVSGPMLVAEQLNKNKRMYPGHIMEREVNRYIEDRIKTRTAWGELGHPNGPKVNEDRISHIVRELHREGNTYIGKAKVTDTPMGDIARGLIADGAIGASSRGLGSLKEDAKLGGSIVQDDFRLAVAMDFVTDPSGPGCFVQGIMENVQYWYDAAKGTYVEERIDDYKSAIHKMSKSELESRALGLMESFLEGLSRKNSNR